MANAVVGDYGDIVHVDTGQDLSARENLTMYIKKPDGTNLVKTSVDGVVMNAADHEVMDYKIEQNLLDIDGTYLFSAEFDETTGQTGNFSQATPTEYIVKRRNQTP